MIAVHPHTLSVRSVRLCPVMAGNWFWLQSTLSRGVKSYALHSHKFKGKHFSSIAGAKKRVLLAIANGSEEIEAVTVADTLVRAGAHVEIASVEKTLQVQCSRGLKIVADKNIEQCRTLLYDLIVVPGGMPGARTLAESDTLCAIMSSHARQGLPVGAICAAPAVVLARHGLLAGRKATCYPAPSFIEMLEHYTDEKVVEDGSIITSQGPATAMLFAVTLVKVLYGSAHAEQIAKDMLCD